MSSEKWPATLTETYLGSYFSASPERTKRVEHIRSLLDSAGMQFQGLRNTPYEGVPEGLPGAKAYNGNYENLLIAQTVAGEERENITLDDVTVKSEILSSLKRQHEKTKAATDALFRQMY